MYKIKLPKLTTVMALDFRYNFDSISEITLKYYILISTFSQFT